MHLLRLDRLSDRAVRQLSSSFEDLPATDHKDGQDRLRRYSMIELMIEPKAIKELPVSTFTQTDEYNDFQGNVERHFENIDKDTLNSDGMKELIYSFRTINNLHPATLIDIHQMRVVTLPDGTAEVSPEGVHQDGYDFISMIGIARHNIEGGHLLVYLNKEDENFISLPLEGGHMVTLKDDELWHNASPIVVVDKGERGYMDAFILTTKINRRKD